MSENVALTECPVCHAGRLSLLHGEEEIPGFGRVVILTYKCNSCGYKVNDVIPVEQREPSEYTAHIENVEDLKIKVLRASTGFIEIPELGVEIEPGPAAQGFITNIEGLLYRVEEAASVLDGDPEAQGRLQEFLSKLKRAVGGELKFTVVVKDPTGASALASEQPGKVERRPLKREEVEELRRMLVGLAFELR